MVVSIQPKHILGSFSAPDLETVITTDGYVIKGYENLLNTEKFSLKIGSPKKITEDQQLVLSPLEISFLNQTKTYLASQGYQLSEAYISSQPREIIFKLKNFDFDIIALTTRDPVEQAIVLALALDFFTDSEKENEKINELLEPAEDTEIEDDVIPRPTEYIDVRLIDRVIYK